MEVIIGMAHMPLLDFTGQSLSAHHRRVESTPDHVCPRKWERFLKIAGSVLVFCISRSR